MVQFGVIHTHTHMHSDSSQTWSRMFIKHALTHTCLTRKHDCTQDNSSALPARNANLSLSWVCTVLLSSSLIHASAMPFPFPFPFPYPGPGPWEEEYEEYWYEVGPIDPHPWNEPYPWVRPYPRTASSSDWEDMARRIRENDASKASSEAPSS